MGLKPRDHLICEICLHGELFTMERLTKAEALKKLLMQKTSVFSSGQDGATLEGADGPVPDNISPQILSGWGGGSQEQFLSCDDGLHSDK